jgi:hypothetical protein
MRKSLWVLGVLAVMGLVGTAWGDEVSPAM